MIELNFTKATVKVILTFLFSIYWWGIVILSSGYQNECFCLESGVWRERHRWENLWAWGAQDRKGECFPFHTSFVQKYWNISVAFLPLWSLAMPGFECKLKGFPKVNHMPFFKDFAKSTVYGDSHGADAMIPWWGKSQQNKGEKLMTKNVQNVSPPPFFPGWLSKSLWQVHVVRWLWVSLEPAKLWQRFHHTWKHQLVLWSLSECWLLGDHHPSYHKRYG